MKTRAFFLVLLLGLLLAAFIVVIPTRSVSAQCFDPQNPNVQIPCPPGGAPNPTKPPRDFPTREPTSINQPPANPNAVPSPICPNNPPAGSQGDPGSDQPGTNPMSNPGQSPINGSFFDVFMIGGGILIGLLLGGFGGFRFGISRIRESALGGGLKNGSFFDDSAGKGVPGGGDTDPVSIGPKHDDPAGSFFDDSAGKGVPGGGDDPHAIGPKHDDPAGSFFDDSGDPHAIGPKHDDPAGSFFDNSGDPHAIGPKHDDPGLAGTPGTASTIGGPGGGGPGDVSATGGHALDPSGGSSGGMGGSTPKPKLGGGPASDGPGSGVGGG